MQPRGYINFTEPRSGRAAVLPTFLKLAARCPSWPTVTPHTWDLQDSCPCGTSLPNFGMSRLQGDTRLMCPGIISHPWDYRLRRGHSRHARGPGSATGPLALQWQPSFSTAAEAFLRVGLILVMRISSGLQWVILPRNLKSEMAVVYPNSALSKAGLDCREKNLSRTCHWGREQVLAFWPGSEHWCISRLGLCQRLLIAFFKMRSDSVKIFISDQIRMYLL